MLKISEVKRAYRLSRDTFEIALKGIDFEMGRGEFVAIYGPSGCGKSTLLNILGGLDSEFSGDVLVDGENLRDFSKSRLSTYRRNRIGFIFQNFNLISHMTVFDNIMTAAELSPLSTRKKKFAVEKALEVVGLTEFKKKLPNQLSGGQRQRVAIARALVNDPDIIIADEPTGALDTETSVEILKFLRELSDAGKLVIVVTHNEEVAEFGTRIIKMRDGLVESDVQTGTSTTLDMPKIENKKSTFNFFGAIKFSYKNFMQRKGRNILVGLGTSIGLIGILLSLSLGNGVTQEVNTLVNNSGDPREIAVMAIDPLTQAPNSQGISDAMINKFTGEIGEENIVEKNKIFQFPTVSYKQGDVSTELGKFQLATGGSSNYQTYLSSDETVIYGKPQSSADQKGIFITQQLSYELNNVNPGEQSSYDHNNSIGKEITLAITLVIDNKPQSFNITTSVLGVFKEGSLISIPNTITKAQTDEFLATNNLENKILPFQYDVLLKDSQLAEEIPTEYMESKEFFVFSQKQGLSMLNTVISIIQTILAFVAGLSIIVAMVMISIVLYISVIERTREIGTLKAIGYKGSHILTIFLFEAMLIGVVANVVAIIVATGLAAIINSVISTSIGINNAILFLPQTVIGLVIISVIAAIISGLYPSIIASKKDPATALRYE